MDPVRAGHVRSSRVSKSERGACGKFWSSSKGGTSAGLIDTSALLARSGSADLGYYGAFVLDPDGHNIEVVSHNR